MTTVALLRKIASDMNGVVQHGSCVQSKHGERWTVQVGGIDQRRWVFLAGGHRLADSRVYELHEVFGWIRDSFHRLTGCRVTPVRSAGFWSCP